MSYNHRFEIDRVRLFLALEVGRGDAVCGMRVIDDYLRACAWRSWLINVVLVLCAVVPLIGVLVVRGIDWADGFLLLLGMVVVMITSNDVARTFLNHERWQWLWPAPPAVLGAMFAKMWSSCSMIQLDTLRITHDPWGRRRAVPELRIEWANKI